MLKNQARFDGVKKRDIGYFNQVEFSTILFTRRLCAECIPRPALCGEIHGPGPPHGPAQLMLEFTNGCAGIDSQSHTFLLETVDVRNWHGPGLFK
jgi:hypothetical protein